MANVTAVRRMLDFRVLRPRLLHAMTHSHEPLRTGAWLAVLAAIAFGVTTPFIQRLGGSAQPLTTAALLYAGAALATIRGSQTGREAPVTRAHAPRLVAVGICGAALAPTALAWGLGHTSASSASLLLNLEAVFTVLLARALYKEAIGRRVALAVALMVLGGAALVVGGGLQGASWLGLLAVTGATFGWALDNSLTRPLADLDPAAVVRWKALVGATLSLAASRAFGETLPTPWHALGLLACGATGYGLSLRLYLKAQRTLGAARTGSIFAVAPFVGVGAALALGDRPALVPLLGASVLFLAGIYLHLTEKHRHAHVHEPMDHDHAHRHDDGHHDHAHDPPVVGEHAHPHHHVAAEHDHPHAPDLHHGHRHD
jgi:drug/metabolite transporter (DMT)-like permease